MRWLDKRIVGQRFALGIIHRDKVGYCIEERALIKRLLINGK